jgi:putative transposase
MTNYLDQLSNSGGNPLLHQLLDLADQRGRYMSLETMAPLSDDPNIMLSAVPAA